jgi:hypothetical protein
MVSPDDICNAVRPATLRLSEDSKTRALLDYNDRAMGSHLLKVVTLAAFFLSRGAWAEPLLEATPVPTRGYGPLLGWEPLKTRIEIPLSVVGRLEGTGDYPVDFDRKTGHHTVLDGGLSGNLQFRLGLTLDARNLLAPFGIRVEYEHDLVTGVIAGKPELAGDGLPNAGGLDHQLRKARGRVSLGSILHLAAGVATMHWGMGLIENDGAHGWRPGSARFTDPRGGDRTARVSLATGPLTRVGLYGALGYDWIRGDDLLLEGDRARRVFGTITVGHGASSTAGIHGVWRRQTAADGDVTEAATVDLYGGVSVAVTELLRLGLELEGALVFGVARSDAGAERDVLQVGFALRASVEQNGRVGAVLDFLYASGDDSSNDDQLRAFKPDPNFELGILLYRHLLAAHTGRATARDPGLLVRPPEDLKRFPSRGAAENTVAIFPRVWWRATAFLEVYGGPLFAFTAAALADPKMSRLSGGVPRNGFDAAPGRFLGAELDVGTRLEAVVGGTQCALAAELGVVLPGGAFETRDGVGMDAVLGGRLIASYVF